MAAGDLITNDWEMEYGGVLFGGDSAFSLASVEGLADLPGIVSSDRDRLRRHGRIAGDDFLVGREIVVSVEVYGANTSTFSAAMNDLRRITTPGSDEAELVFRIPGIGDGGKCYIKARPRKRSLPVAKEFFYRIPVASIAFYSTDPRIYSLTPKTGSASNPSSVGGMQFPETGDLNFAPIVGGQPMTLTNAGTFHTPVKFRVQGPITDPVVENLTTGQRLSLDLTLSSGDYVELCGINRTVMLNGSQSRYPSLSADSSWWDLPPGDTVVQLRGDMSTTGTVTALYQDAWV